MTQGEPVEYHVWIHPLVEEYLSRSDVIGDQARERLADALIYNLTHHGEQFRTQNVRVRPGSPCFWYDHVLSDNGQWRHFWFAVSDARHVVGVLIVGYVERRP
jgi:hypothetical protein